MYSCVVTAVEYVPNIIRVLIGSFYKGSGRGGLEAPRPPWRVRGGVCV